MYFVLEKSDTHNGLHVLEGDWFLQHHLVERPNEESFEKHKHVRVCKILFVFRLLLLSFETPEHSLRAFSEVLTIKQFPMIHSHACYTADELEVGQVVLIT